MSSLLLTTGLLDAHIGERVTQQRQVAEPFTEIVLAGPEQLVLAQGEPAGVTVLAGERMMDDVVVDVRDGVLHLGLRPALLRLRQGRVAYRVTVPEITSVTVDGAGEVDAGPMRVADLRVVVAGSGHVDAGDVTATDVVVEVSGSGAVRLGGRARSLDAQLVGASTLEASRLSVRDGGVPDVTG